MRTKLLALGLFAALVPLALSVTGGASGQGVTQYWVCHTTGSGTNPYVLIPVPLHTARSPHIGQHLNRGPQRLSDAFAFAQPGQLNPPDAARVRGNPGQDRSRVTTHGAHPKPGVCPTAQPPECPPDNQQGEVDNGQGPVCPPNEQK